MGGDLRKNVTFGTKSFVRYSRHIRYLGSPLLGGFTVKAQIPLIEAFEKSERFKYFISGIQFNNEEGQQSGLNMIFLKPEQIVR